MAVPAKPISKVELHPLFPLNVLSIINSALVESVVGIINEENEKFPLGIFHSSGVQAFQSFVFSSIPNSNTVSLDLTLGKGVLILSNY